MPVPGPERSKRWRLLAYAAAALFGFSMLAATAALVGVTRQAPPFEALAMVRTQLAELGEGRRDEAYARLSDTWRARLSREEFGKLVSAHPGLGRYAHHSFRNRSMEGDRVRFEGTLVSDEGEREDVTIELVKERGAWAVAGIRFAAR